MSRNEDASDGAEATVTPLWLRWLPFGLNLVYAGLLILILPVVLYRMIAHGRYRQGIRQKFLGRLPRLSVEHSSTGIRRERFWFHAVSVGEVLLLETVLQLLKEHSPETEIVISASTDTGYELAKSRYPEHVVCFFPLDFTWAVRTAIGRIRPTRIVLAELELWPGFLIEAARQGIPLTLINGRLSERSFRGYSRVRTLMRALLRQFDCLCVQNESYAGRFRSLGASADRICVTGSVKFDRVETDRDNPATLHLRNLFGLSPSDRVLVAGSTMAPEERVVVRAWLSVRKQFPDLRLILVPRHRERFEEAAGLIESMRLPLCRRSQLDDDDATAGSSTVSNTVEESSVVLLDTLGELSACWGLADLAFVGGSMGRRGGQNMIEPSGFGAAVCFGPDTHNFRDVVEALLNEDAARVVRDEDELAKTLIDWLTDPAAAAAQGNRAREFVRTQLGASQRTVEKLLSMNRLPSDEPSIEAECTGSRAA